MIKKYSILISLLLLGGFVLLSSCSKKVKPVTVVVEDPDRHYYPIVQGQALEINYGIINTSDDPLFINEIQPSCGCMIVNEKFPILVLPRKHGFIHIKYNSIKNVGEVKHYIRCYGNFARGGMLELRFDVNVVPSADYNHDYEELFRTYQEKNGKLKEAVDGKTTQQGYYTGNP